MLRSLLECCRRASTSGRECRRSSRAPLCGPWLRFALPRVTSWKKGAGQRVAEFSETLLAEGVREPWSIDSQSGRSKERTYLCFFARICLMRLVEPELADQIEGSLYQELRSRLVTGRRWRLPNPEEMKNGIRKYGDADVSDLSKLIEHVGWCFAESTENRLGIHGSDGDRKKVAILAMDAFVLSELRPFISGCVE